MTDRSEVRMEGEEVVRIHEVEEKWAQQERRGGIALERAPKHKSTAVGWSWRKRSSGEPGTEDRTRGSNTMAVGRVDTMEKATYPLKEGKAWRKRVRLNFAKPGMNWKDEYEDKKGKDEYKAKKHRNEDESNVVFGQQEA